MNWLWLCCTNKKDVTNVESLEKDINNYIFWEEPAPKKRIFSFFHRERDDDPKATLAYDIGQAYRLLVKKDREVIGEFLENKKLDIVDEVKKLNEEVKALDEYNEDDPFIVKLNQYNAAYKMLEVVIKDFQDIDKNRVVAAESRVVKAAEAIIAEAEKNCPL